MSIHFSPKFAYVFISWLFLEQKKRATGTPIFMNDFKNIFYDVAFLNRMCYANEFLTWEKKNAA